MCMTLMLLVHILVKYLWFLMYMWIHLRAEEGKQTNLVPLSEVVALSTGREQDLVLHHLSADHYRSGEPKGLAQNAICRMETTAEWMVSV